MDKQRELFYKQRSRKGPGDRAVRARQKDMESKANRATLLASKRRIPLSEIQEDEKKGAVSKLTAKEKQDRRMEQLKEWQKKRDEAKKLEQQRKKKPFSAGSKPPVLQPQISLSNLGDSLTCKNKLPKPLAVQKPKSITQPSKATEPSTSKVTRPPKQPQSAKPPKSSKQPVTKTQRRTPPVTRSSSRLASKPQTRNPPTKPNTSGTTRIAKSTKNTVSSAPNQKTQGSASKKGRKLSPKVARGKNSGKKASVQKPKSPQKKEEVERVSPMKNMEPENISPTADVQTKTPSLPTPQYKHARSSYIPPSPCYVSVHPNSTEREIYVNDPAWIPGAMAKSMTPRSGATCPNFDETFRTFSPFQFKAGVNSSSRGFAFTFRKSVGTTPRSLMKDSLRPPNLNISVDSLGGVSSTVENTPSPPPLESPVSKAIRHSMGNLSMSGSRVVRERKRSLVVEVELDSQEEEEEQKSSSEMKPPLILDLNEASTEDLTTSNKTPNGPTSSSTSIPSPPLVDSDLVDLTYFHKLHSDVTTRLTGHCRDWEEKSGSLEEQEDISEDVLGQIRTTVCQAQLLMRQKLKQYLSLVEEASKDQRPTTSDDLQGFWDMVYFQVEDVDKKFEQLSELERNGWKQVAKQPKGRKAKRRMPAASKPSSEESSSESNERLMAAREKRQASRNRLREMKAAAKRAREGEKAVVTDLPSPKKTRDKEDADVTPFKSSRRRSSRKLRRRASDLISFDEPEEPSSSQITPPTSNPSVFSPPMSSSSSSSSHQHTSTKSPLPTAQLLSFTPGKAVKKSHCTLHPGTTPSHDQGAFQRMFVSITPTKKLRLEGGRKDLIERGHTEAQNSKMSQDTRELAGTDVIMSPARRSVRLAERGVKCSAEKMVLPSLTQVPDDVDFAYCPNNALL